MAYKKLRLGPRIVEAARSGERYRDAHVFIGGTGAVGGTALLQMLDMYEEMMTAHPPPADAVPLLITTGLGPDDIGGFARRLFRWSEARWGKDWLPTGVRDGYLTHSGVFIALERFRVQLLPGLAEVSRIQRDYRRDYIDNYLQSLGTAVRAPAAEVHAALKAAIAAAHPFCDFLVQYRAKHLANRPGRYRSVHLGIPLPSLIAYHKPALVAVAAEIPALRGELLGDLVRAFEIAVRDDVATMQRDHADHVLVAHTTAVGGMFDEVSGKRRPRLGFAHSAVDANLAEKHAAAEALTALYAQAGVRMLITAAGIGVDEVQVASEVPTHGAVQQKLFDAPREIFPGSKEAMPADARRSREAGRPVPRRQMARCYPPQTVPFGDSSAPAQELTFQRGWDIRPSYVIRSGENGYFSVANAEALYRVMRVATASELGLVLASVGLLGDDPQDPWFKDNICYYTETDNSRQAFDFLAQPMLRQTQLNGLDPMSLQDLGDAKHQGELHLLGLLILLHRLRTLDIDAIPPYVDLQHFDPRTFFVHNSRPLLFEDLAAWDLAQLAADLTALAQAETPEELAALKPFQHGIHRDLFPLKNQARERVLREVLAAVWNVPALGSPLLYAAGGAERLRVGYYAAPLDLLVADTGSVEAEIRRLHAGSAAPLPLFREHLIAARGFVDLRPQATVTWASDLASVSPDNTAVARTEGELREILARIPHYAAFTTSGLLATLFRLRALHGQFEEAMIELGTLQDSRWNMPRDEAGHILVIPGIVEAFRHASEGLEKATGTERIAGMWGYERRPVADRRAALNLPPPRGKRRG